MHGCMHILSNISACFFPFPFPSTLICARNGLKSTWQLKNIITYNHQTRESPPVMTARNLDIGGRSCPPNVWGAQLWISLNKYFSWLTSNPWTHKLVRADLVGCSVMYLQKQYYLQRILIGAGYDGGHSKRRMTFTRSGYLSVPNHGIGCAVRKRIWKDKREKLSNWRKKKRWSSYKPPLYCRVLFYS